MGDSAWMKGRNAVKLERGLDSPLLWILRSRPRQLWAEAGAAYVGWEGKEVIRDSA